jgi:hypothetical protein
MIARITTPSKREDSAISHTPTQTGISQPSNVFNARMWSNARRDS